MEQITFGEAVAALRKAEEVQPEQLDLSSLDAMIDAISVAQPAISQAGMGASGIDSLACTRVLTFCNLLGCALNISRNTDDRHDAICKAKEFLVAHGATSQDPLCELACFVDGSAPLLPAHPFGFVDLDGDFISFKIVQETLVEYVNDKVEVNQVKRLEWNPSTRVLRDDAAGIPVPAYVDINALKTMCFQSRPQCTWHEVTRQ